MSIAKSRYRLLVSEHTYNFRIVKNIGIEEKLSATRDYISGQLANPDLLISDAIWGE
jgi:hypothetical protein